MTSDYTSVLAVYTVSTMPLCLHNASIVSITDLSDQFLSICSTCYSFVVACCTSSGASGECGGVDDREITVTFSK